MAEIQRRDDLPEELPRLLGREPSLFHQIVEQLATGNVLQHQISAKLCGILFPFLPVSVLIFGNTQMGTT